jgi:branched-chain amino acid transport system substrate-binding protein
MVTDFLETDGDVINALIAEDSSAYAAENKITERCS